MENPKLPEPPLAELIEIKTIDYEKNPNATYCKRPIEMIDTIVIHHSASSSLTTPTEINHHHINRSSNGNEWYMVGYSYLINAPYKGNSSPELQVTQGRPLDIVGSHAGSFSFTKMNNEQKKMWNDELIKCGKPEQEFKVDQDLINGEKIKTNVTSIGVVVIGNYAPFSPYNPGGYDPKSPRNPTLETLDAIARLSCQLQKSYPRMKNIKWHSYYKDTSCPGNLRERINKIISLSKEYGCEFF